MSDNEFATAYVDLDSIFDTRLSLLTKLTKENILQPEELEHILLHNYYNRTSDFIIPNFLDYYKKRDKQLLLTPFLTPIIDGIKSFVITTSLNKDKTPLLLNAKIELNIYPYVLEEEEIDNIIKGLVVLTDRVPSISIINTPPEYLTPNFIKDKYKLMFMYESREWFKTHYANENFKKQTCPSVILKTPFLHYVEEDKDPETFNDVIKNSKGINAKLISKVEKDLKPIINIEYLPVQSFCYHLKITN